MNNKLNHFTLIGAIAIACVANAANINNLKPGTLKDCNISDNEVTLTISGQMDASDFSYIFDNLNELKELNISEADIVAYSGAPLKYTGLSSSAAHTLPDYALTGMSNLTSITLPKSLKHIGKGSLSGTGLTALSVPQGVLSIADYALMRCSELTSIEIPESVTSLGERAFAYCTKLERVSIFASINSVPEGLFEACGGLKEVNLEYLASCNEIGAWALAECNGIETLILPHSSQIIGDASLYGTAGVKLLKLPESLTYIGNDAMTAMTALNTLNASEVQTMPELGENVWGRIDKKQVTLVTPNGQEEDYKTSEQWNEFNIVPLDQWQSSTQNIGSEIAGNDLTVRIHHGEMIISTNNSNLGTVSVYNVKGTRIATAVATNNLIFNISNWVRGVYLVVTSSGISKVAI